MNYFTLIVIIIIISYYNVIGYQPLLRAILNNDKTSAHGIIANPQTNINQIIDWNNVEISPLKLAIELNRIDIIKYLLSRKELAINAPMPGKKNLNPLQWSLFTKNEQLIKTLLTSSTIDLNVQIGENSLLTAVIIQMRGNNIGIIKAILANNNFDPAMLKQKDAKGKTPIDWAKMYKNDEAVKLFEDKAKEQSSTNKDNAFKTSINNKDDTSKTDTSDTTAHKYVNKPVSELSTQGHSTAELDSTYFKKQHEFLNEPETKQKDLKTALVIKELDQFQKNDRIRSDLDWNSLDIDERCVFIWSTGAYTRINKALREDKDNYGLNYWMPCIAGIVNYLETTESKDIITYRGTSLPIEQSQLYKLHTVENELVTVVNFLSTSKQEKLALTYPLSGKKKGAVKVLFVITIPENVAAVDIENISNFPNEYEVLLKPYTVFRVIGYSTEGKKRPYIYVEIVDCTKNDCSRAYVRRM